MTKLYIAVISENMKRASLVIDAIEKMEQGNVIKKYKSDRKLITNDAIYKAYNIQRIDGLRVDQVILDYAIDKRMLKPILFLSCVPDRLQIIDDRIILN